MCESIDKKKVILYIDIDNLDITYQTNKDEIEFGRSKHLQFINSKKTIQIDYQRIINALYKLDAEHNELLLKQKSQFAGGVKIHRKRYIRPDGSYLEVGCKEYNAIASQCGGGILSALAVLGTYAVTGFVMYFIYISFNPDEQCNSQYPLYPRNKVPSVDLILEKILPGNWIKDSINSGKDLSSSIDEVSKTLITLTETFSIFDEDVGSTTTKITKSVTKVSLSVGAAVVTGGLGGDKLVNIPVLIAKSVSMTTKTFNKLLIVVNKIIRVLKKISDGVSKVQKNVDTAVNALNTADNKRQKMIDNFNQNKTQIHFIYDLFNINFNNGPYSTICWTDYIMKYYLSSNRNVKEIYTLICLMNDIYLEINNSVIGFMGAAMDMVIPVSMGLAGTIAPLLKNFSYVLYNQVRNQITDNYKNIPFQFRDLIQHPEKLSTNLFNMFSVYTQGASDQLISGNIKTFMKKGIDSVATGVNKGFGMLYMFLNVFIIFSELNSGINKSFASQNIDAEQLIADCGFCGSFDIDTIDTNTIDTNTIDTNNEHNIENCSRCKKFFLKDPNVEISNPQLLEKCVKYRKNTDSMKVVVKKSIANAGKKPKK
jgi:hypothetical protein